MARRVLFILGILGGVFVFLFGLGLISVFVLPSFVAAWREGEVLFFVGAVVIFGIAIVSVSRAGPSLLRGIPFHAAGVLGPFMVGSIISSLERLTVAGGFIYLASWAWIFLGDTLVRSVRTRRSSSAENPPTEEANSP